MRNMLQSDAYNTINDRAARDAAFRTRLLANPHAAIKEATGTDVEKNFRIKFIEKEAGLDVLVVLPDLRTAPVA